MSYCDPAWISDFSFQLIEQRMTAVDPVHGMADHVSSSPDIHTQQNAGGYARLLVRPDGSAEWLEGRFSAPHTGRHAMLLPDNSANGKAGEGSSDGPPIAARFYPFDHLDGGIVTLPAQALSRADGRFTLALSGRHIRLRVR